MLGRIGALALSAKLDVSQRGWNAVPQHFVDPSAKNCDQRHRISMLILTSKAGGSCLSRICGSGPLFAELGARFHFFLQGLMSVQCLNEYKHQNSFLLSLKDKSAECRGCRKTNPVALSNY